ncbi:MAG: hypothetical protein LBD17_02705 [Endomicrobium sp.]|jgi:hypothetical protein|nr:hypothetical protein [Endomicrobium sp.]
MNKAQRQLIIDLAFDTYMYMAKPLHNAEDFLQIVKQRLATQDDKELISLTNKGVLQAVYELQKVEDNDWEIQIGIFNDDK